MEQTSDLLLASREAAQVRIPSVELTVSLNSQYHSCTGRPIQQTAPLCLGTSMFVSVQRKFNSSAVVYDTCRTMGNAGQTTSAPLGEKLFSGTSLDPSTTEYMPLV